jgi:predicted RNase H-like HicB family nuclease
MSDETNRVTLMAEFELVPDEGYVMAFPVGLTGATEGRDVRDAVEMAADWLTMTAQDYLIKGKPLPELPLGTLPTRGGRMVAVAIHTSLADVPAVSAAEAARLLGVSTARIAQLCKAGALESWKTGSGRMVSLGSIEGRLEEMRDRSLVTV